MLPPHTILALALLLGLSLPGPARAQVGVEAGPEVEPGYRVRLATEGDTLQGRWLSRDHDLLRLETDGGVRTVPLPRVRRLWVRGTRARQGTYIGGVAGAVVTGVFVGLLAEALCEVECEGGGEFAVGLALGGGIGAVGGGILGGVVGSWILTWRPVWP